MIVERIKNTTILDKDVFCYSEKANIGKING